MAPSDMKFSLYGRQTAVPTCVTTCMTSGDLGTCTSLLDLQCLCSSTTYATSVATCWASNCTPDEISVGQAYSASSCAAYIGNSTTSGTNSTGTSTTNSTASPTGSITPAQSSVVTTGYPVIYQKAFVNVQAIMSSICAALLLLALILGFMACRARVRRDRESAQRSTWTGVGGSTFGQTDTKGKSQLFSRTGQTSSNFTNARGDAANRNTNFGVTSSNFGGTTTIDFPESSFAANSYGINRERYGIPKPERTSVNRGGGFSNRDAANARQGEEAGEQWEMTVKHSNSTYSMSKSDTATALAESPTTPTTRMGDSEVNLGSTAELTKHCREGGQGGPGGRGEAF